MLDNEYILQFKDIKDLHRSLSQNLTEKYGYYNIDELAGLILEKFNIDLRNNLECWANLRENYYRRNIIVHNDGKISELYLKKMSLGNDQLNQELNCDIEYLWKSHYDIQSYMDFIDDSIREKFKLKSRIDSI